MSKQHKNFYMHTIDGKPAKYYPGDQICFIYSSCRANLKFANSLKQIRSEQKKSIEFRRKRGYINTPIEKGYGYLLFRLDVEELAR